MLNFYRCIIKRNGSKIPVFVKKACIAYLYIIQKTDSKIHVVVKKRLNLLINTLLIDILFIELTLRSVYLFEELRCLYHSCN